MKDEFDNEIVLANRETSAITWMTVTPDKGTIATSLTLTLIPSELKTEFGNAYLVIIGDSRAGLPPDNVRLVPITALRATQLIYLPLIRF